MQSLIREVGQVSFPRHTNERIYMVPFLQREGLPREYERWQATVDAMLVDIKTDSPIYMMVDQGVIKAGVSHRRPGMHIDGYWIPAIQAHSTDNGGSHYVPEKRKREERGEHATPSGAHATRLSGRHGHITYDDPSIRKRPGVWKTQDAWTEEAIILASSHAACKVLTGEWEGRIGKGGDCSHLDLSHMDELIMQSNTAYSGNLFMLHESMPVEHDVARTLVRLNVPGILH